LAKKQENDHIPEPEKEFKAWFKEMVKPVKSDPQAVFVMAAAEELTRENKWEDVISQYHPVSEKLPEIDMHYSGCFK
jgi:hypothetical protein